MLLNAASSCFPDAKLLARLIDFPSSPDSSYPATYSAHPSSSLANSVLTAWPAFWDTGIPGRKATQIKAFSQAIVFTDNPLLEWCSGKQHLGRLLAEHFQQDCIGLEIDTSLVKQANTLAAKRRSQLNIHSVSCDVLSALPDQYIHKDHHLVALHACGGLHTALIKKAVAHKVSRLSFSPCCYHRYSETDSYSFMSAHALSGVLPLSRDDLRMATRETKTASQAETDKRRKLQAWRLGFDSLQRASTGKDCYLETPPLSPTILQKGFLQFCRELADIKRLTLKPNLDFKLHEDLGFQRYREFEQAELTRMLFRRALETLIVLDKALFLEEQGYQARISLFCSSDVSPRNFFVDAVKPAR